MRRLLPLASLVLLVVGGACRWAGGAAVAARVADDVEPHVRDAFVAAWGRLPAPWRELLGDVELHRASALGVPADAPLCARLLDRAALAYFRNVARRVYVTDAGARLAPQWLAEPPTRAQVGAFLLDEVGIDPGSGGGDRVDGAWREFVRRVFAWHDDAVPEPMPPVGDVAVFDRFLQRGVWRALGGEVSLEELLFHELAHAVQNDLRRMTAQMLAWGTVSGWRETDDGDPADGFAGGAFAIERPDVLVRLLLDLPRGPSIYAPHPSARFLNRYARFDLREDFAECARQMAYRPDDLLRHAPAKFLYLNALGWNARLDVRAPGPLWIGAARLRRADNRERVVAGARALLNESASAPVPNPLVVAAILRAHERLLHAADLPPANPPLACPPDLPPELLERLPGARFTFAIDGVARQPSPAAVRAVWDEELTRWIDHHEFGRDLETLLGSTAEELRERYRREVLAAPDAVEREQRFDRMLLSMDGTLPSDELASLCRAEAAAQQAAGRRLVAVRLRLLAGDVSVDASEVRSSLSPASATANGDGDDYATIELLAAIARSHLDAGNRDAAAATIRRIPGATFGAYRRVQFWLAVGEPDNARRAVASVELPRLRDKLASLLPDKGP